MVFLNGTAIVEIIISFVIALGLQSAGIVNEYISLMLLCIMFIISDLAIRMPSDLGELVHPKSGGHMVFIPIWVWGIILLIVYSTGMA